MKNKLFFISVIIMVIYFLSAVSAADVNCTCDDLEIEGENNLELSDVSDVCDNSSACDTLGVVSDDYNDCDDLSNDEDCLGDIEIHPPRMPNNVEVHGPIYSNCDDYNELQKLIYKNSVVDLDRDYHFSVGVPFNINKDVTIDGHGHAISFNTLYSHHELLSNGIKSSYGNVVLKNLIIHNGMVNYDGGGLFIEGSACYTLINCTFVANSAWRSGGAIFNSNKNPLKVINCSFSHNTGRDVGGAIYSKGDVYVVNSNFGMNFAYHYGGAIYSLGKVEVINSSFNYNQANKDYTDIRCEGVLIFKNSIVANSVSRASKDRISSISSKIGIIKDDSAFKDKNINYDRLSEKILNKPVVNLWLDKRNDLENLFKFIKDYNPSWNLLNITLAPGTACILSAKEFKETYNSYAVRLTIPVVKINGNTGSYIYGNGLSLMYVVPTSQVILSNVDVRNFDTVFVNYGTVICKNSHFDYIKNYLAANLNSISFENCAFTYFKQNSKSPIKLLYADGNSLNVFSHCNYRDYLGKKDVLCTASGKSNVIVYSDVPLGNDFHNSVFSEASTLSVISTNLNSKNGTVFNCSDVDEFCKVITSINRFSSIGKIIINLEPKEYTFTWDMFNSLSNCKGYECNPGICVGLTPIVINGNGASIKINDCDMGVFARISPISTFIVNNVSFSNFYRVFENYGNLIVSNCSFESFNRIDLEASALVKSDGGKNNFKDCTFKNVYKPINLQPPTDFRIIIPVESKKIAAFELVDSELYLNNCKMDECGSAMNSVIYCSKELFTSFDRCANANIYHYLGGTQNITIYRDANVSANVTSPINVPIFNTKNIVPININNSESFSVLDKAIRILSLSNVILKIHCNCDIDLEHYNGLQNIIIYTNGYDVKFKPCTIDKKLSVYICNSTLSGYNIKELFKNEGSLYFVNCNFKNNNIQNCLVNNKGTCIFQNCSFTNNIISKNLIYNEGALAIVNSSLSLDKKNIQLIYNEGFVSMLNVSSINRNNVLVFNQESGLFSAFNSPDIDGQFHYSEPKKTETKKGWNKLALGLGIAVTAVVGMATGGLGFAVTGSFMVGAIIGVIGGVAAGLICAAVDHLVAGDDLGKCLLVYCLVGAAAGIAGSAIGSLLTAGCEAGADVASHGTRLMFDSETASVESGMYASSGVSSIHTEDIEYVLADESLREIVFGVA